MPQEILIAYIPVIHKGYLNFLQKYEKVDKILLLGSDVIAEFDHLRKDVRSLEPQQVEESLKALGFSHVEVASLADIKAIDKTTKLIMPDEDIMHELAEKYLSAHTIEYDTVFLRWDKKKTLAEVQQEDATEVSSSEFDHEMMKHAFALAQRSADWWRQVGAVLAKEGRFISGGYNHHVPHEQQPYFDGDPRGNFHAGEYIELSTAMHAEADLIAEAAREGWGLEGASIYVTTFPCPVCAKLIAYSGIKKLYFSTGYAMLDGESILKANGVEIFRVESKK